MITFCFDGVTPSWNADSDPDSKFSEKMALDGTVGTTASTAAGIDGAEISLGCSAHENTTPHTAIKAARSKRITTSSFGCDAPATRPTTYCSGVVRRLRVVRAFRIASRPTQ